MDEVLDPEVIASLRSFHEGEKMRRIVLSYITNQLATKEELEKNERMFRKLDTNGDGKLDRQELINGLRGTYGELTEIEVAKIMKAVDLDGSGEIDISEWNAASASFKGVVTHDRLRSAFDFFDKDRSGNISVRELKEALNAGKVDDAIWEGIFKEVDIDGSGEIDFAEFEAMMTKLSQSVIEKQQ